MPQLQAVRMIRELRLRPDVQLTADAVHDLVLQATGDREQAEEAWKSRVAAQLRAGQTPQ